MNGKKAKLIRRIAKAQGIPYRIAKKIYNDLPRKEREDL